MRQLWRSIRYSGFGLFIAGVVSFIQGCTPDDLDLVFILWLILSLFGGGPQQDPGAGGPTHIYWSESVDDAIMRCALVDIPCKAADATVVAKDGADFNNPQGLALHDGFIYWAERGNDVIRRCALADIPCDVADASIVAQDGAFQFPEGIFIDGGFIY